MILNYLARDDDQHNCKGRQEKTRRRSSEVNHEVQDDHKNDGIRNIDDHVTESATHIINTKSIHISFSFFHQVGLFEREDIYCSN